MLDYEDTSKYDREKTHVLTVITTAATLGMYK